MAVCRFNNKHLCLLSAYILNRAVQTCVRYLQLEFSTGFENFFFLPVFFKNSFALTLTTFEESGNPESNQETKPS